MAAEVNIVMTVARSNDKNEQNFDPITICSTLFYAVSIATTRVVLTRTLGLISIIDCLQSLSFEGMNRRQNELKAAENTCKWLKKHPVFKEWQYSNRGLLWIKVKPGSGKSTLLSHTLAHQILPSEETSMALFPLTGYAGLPKLSRSSSPFV